MSEIETEQVPPEAVSEPEVVESTDREPTMVPLAALQAERRKRQEVEASREDLYKQMLLSQQKQEPQEEEDPKALVEKQDLLTHSAIAKRDILETLYQDMNPEAVQKINQFLKPILEKKPWLAASVDTAQNRYARAYEIVQDYMHLVADKPAQAKSSPSDGQRIVNNAHKPRSPAEVGKSARPEGVEYLKSIQGKKEFRDYRQKVLRGEV
jgi:hypothetical protein